MRIRIGKDTDRAGRYSLANQNSIDLVLFLNGLPVATVELKTDFTQCVQDAVDQYRFDRLPRSKGAAAEPLLAFPSGLWSSSPFPIVR